MMQEVQLTQGATELQVAHSSGFFSCSLVALRCLLDHINTTSTLPSNFIRNNQYTHYKSRDIDMTSLLFEYNPSVETTCTLPINLTSENREDQFSDYRCLNFKDVGNLVNRYFAPSVTILNKVDELVAKYQIDFDNTCAVFYRGNDKIIETEISGYDRFIEKATMKQSKEPNLKFLIQTDENEFLSSFLNIFSNNTTYFHELERLDKSNNCVFFTLPLEKREAHAINYLATIIILSKCKHLITHSGNGGMWAVLYRGHMDGVDQILHDEWL